MSEAELRRVGDGSFELRGPVVFATAGDLLAAGNRLFAGVPEIILDLSKVTRVDSAALALLIEWLRQASHANHSLRFTGMPEKLRSIALLTGTEQIIEPAPAEQR